MSVLLVGLLAFGSSAAVACISWPLPRIHDEFSYLLAGDTFAHGRLANSPHPMAVYLESFYVNQFPTYASMYPPAQGLALAAGQVLGGHPLVGVWLSFGLACAAVCWMLQQWLPARWALVGSLLAMMQVGFVGSWSGIPGYWSQSYWGGSMGMLGGALLFGALRRVTDRPTIAGALVLGLGLAILAISRPFEGLVISVPVAVALFWQVFKRDGPSLRAILMTTFLPLLAVVLGSAAAMGFYNLRVTGEPMRLPYVQFATKYVATPYFLWQSDPPVPTYHHKVFKDFFAGLLPELVRRQMTFDGFGHEIMSRFGILLRFFAGGVLLIPLTALPFGLRKRWTCFAAAACALLIVFGLSCAWCQPHYFAPMTALVFLLFVEGFRQWRCWRLRQFPLGRLLGRMLIVVYLMVVLVSAVGRPATAGTWFDQRDRIRTRLSKEGDHHLIVVRYGSRHSPFDEWVYNAADIDGSPVVWARDMGAEANQPLLNYFHDRKPWLLEIDEPEVRLTPYPVPSGCSSAAAR